MHSTGIRVGVRIRVRQWKKAATRMCQLHRTGTDHEFSTKGEGTDKTVLAKNFQKRMQ